MRRIALDRVIDVVPNVRGVRSSALQFFSREALFGNKVQEQKGEGTEFDALRDYVPGLDSRFIDWKHSARHRKLVSKEFRIERNHQIVLAFDTGYLMVEPVDGLPRLDHAINAGLLLAWISLQGGDLVGLLAFDEMLRQYQQPRRGVSNFPRLQRATAGLDYHHTETNFTLGLAELSARLQRRALVILFTDFVDTVTAELMIEATQRIARQHVVVFVTLRDAVLHGLADAPPDRFERRRQGGDRARLPARARHRVRAAGADRRALSRRAEPQPADRADQPLSSDQAAGPAVSIETEIATAPPTLRRSQRPVIMLKSSEFRRAREQSWLELEAADRRRREARRAQRSTPDQLQRLPLLYRSTLSSLSVARAIALDRHLLLYLENLALRAYLAIYSPPARFSGERRPQFLRAISRRGARRALAFPDRFLALAVGVIAGFWLTVGDESWFTTLVPSGLSGGRGLASTRASLLEGEIFAPWPGAAVSLGHRRQLPVQPQHHRRHPDVQPRPGRPACRRSCCSPIRG